MYVRMFLFVLAVIIFYTLLIFYVPVVGAKIDSTLGVTWNESLSQKVSEIFSQAEQAKNSMEHTLDNPAPNTSRNIKGRMGQ